MALKNYNTHTKISMKLVGKYPSGVKSPEKGGAELLVCEPLKEHPELKGLYRAIDPDTGWRGWVEYAPVATPTPTPPPPTQNDQNNANLEGLMKVLRQKLELVDGGVFTEEELGVEKTRAEIKRLYLLVNPPTTS